MDDDILNSIKKLHINNTEEGKEFMTIVCEGKKLTCDKEILLKECDYFKALERFEKKSNEIELKGEIDFDVLEIIINYLSKGQELPIDLNNFQNILQGCQFLQCSKCEEITINFISQHLESIFVYHPFL